MNLREKQNGRTAVELARACTKPTRTLLVVDDYGPNLDVLARILGDVGEVVMAENGRDALLLLKTFGCRFDVILSDVDMPVMNGVDFFEEAGLLDPIFQERFIFMTGCPNAKNIRFFKEKGVPYLTKPSRAQEIIDLVEEVAGIATTPGPWGCPAALPLENRPGGGKG